MNAAAEKCLEISEEDLLEINDHHLTRICFPPSIGNETGDPTAAYTYDTLAAENGTEIHPFFFTLLGATPNGVTRLGCFLAGKEKKKSRYRQFL
ncbi:hypothetical protein AVEN_172323-1 [Araneus ventricosus]|uniref:Uncharacterized protein n=1 Tax=Araneus ventricosus TaxID=182803 RepID=A0A4Y2E585_ARAVE|nr:hypothetical protein AVEN_172323-1 [Araneus ventricosus]